MQQNFQSSFIPKDPVTEEVFKPKKAGFLGVLSFSLFIATIIAAGAMFAYKSVLKNEISNLGQQVSESEKNLDREAIGEMLQFSKKLNVVESIVLKHEVVSKFLNELASSTVSSVSFGMLDFDNSKDGVLLVDLNGEASGYAAIALQENILSKDEFFQSVTFSNLTLTDRGTVSFDLAITVNPQIVVYSP